jgi:aspartyl-tRNA(Asn)/glutamyl-tRNA(Gln) amidotransferase subunit A
MNDQTVFELAEAIRKKEISSVECTRYFLDRIDRLNPTINAFITVTHDLALQQAQEADKLIAQGVQKPLLGVPVAHKDNLCTKGVKTTCASNMLDNFIAPYESTVTQKIQDAGAVMLGKLNMDEFAMGSSNENSFYGAVKNPWDIERTPGGSSGGSSAAVAAGMTPIATGSDTGGSIRQPAALCGITGFKPTYGRVSRYGLIPLASSFDQAGTLSRDCKDSALYLQVMAGSDDKDSTSSNRLVDDYLSRLNNPIQGLKIGLPEEYLDNASESIQKNIQQAMETFKQLGAQFIPISLPHTRFAPATYYILAPAEASSNLARFDGVRFGYRCKNPHNLEDLYRRSRSEGFGVEVQRRILTGAYVLSAGNYEAQYQKAQKVRRLIGEDFIKAFAQVDIILTPTTPEPAFKLNAKKDPISLYLQDLYTIATSCAGLPGLSIPNGFIDQLPIGVQLIGQHFKEAPLLQAGHQFQMITDWHKHKAPIA